MKGIPPKPPSAGEIAAFTPEDRTRFFRLWPVKAAAFLLISAAAAGFAAGLAASAPSLFMARDGAAGSDIAVLVITLLICVLVVGFIYGSLLLRTIRWLKDAFCRRKLIIRGRLERVVKSKGNRSVRVGGRDYQLAFQDWDLTAGLKEGAVVEVSVAKHTGLVLGIFPR